MSYGVYFYFVEMKLTLAVLNKIINISLDGHLRRFLIKNIKENCFQNEYNLKFSEKKSILHNNNVTFHQLKSEEVYILI